MQGESSIGSDRRIAKNTLMLYARTFITLAISLYTTRVVLKTLGETDYGIYNVVGGVVVLFTFISNSVSSAIQRFLNFELGKTDNADIRKVFSMSVNAIVLITVAILIFAESLGFWFVSTQLNIPEERMNAALWAYQLSVITCCFTILRVPHNAAIIAYEKMSFYAYLSIIEAVLKLILVFFLVYLSWDKLLLYSFLMLFVVIVINICYYLYCRKVLPEIRFISFWDKTLFNRLISFSGWSLFGSGAEVCNTQGINMIINIFLGVTVNAATGIATQVSNAIYSFVVNFQVAFKPQIVKLYASGETEDFHKLIFRSSKISYVLLSLIILPVIINCSFILDIWLDEVPSFSSSFIIWTLLFYLIDSMSAPLWMAAQATGDIKKYQIWVSMSILLNLPLAYLVLALGVSPVWVFVVKFIVNIITHFVRLAYLEKVHCVPFRPFLKGVMFPLLLMTIAAYPIPVIIGKILIDGWGKLFATSLLSIVILGVSAYCITLNSEERITLISLLKSKLKAKS